jgi:phosphoglycerate kinase
MVKAIETRCAIILPVDAIVAFHFAAHAPAHDYGVDAIPAEGMMLDIGQLSIDRVKASISEAATVVWNGPVGAFELAGFEHGTMALARHVAERTKAHKLVSVAGGGDTVAALNAAGVAGDFTYVSTAGGAFLEWMEGKALPGVEALRS